MSEETRINLQSLEYVQVSAEPENVVEFIEHIKSASPYGPKDVLVHAGGKEYHMKYKWPEGYTVTEFEPIPVEIQPVDENTPENTENKPAEPDENEPSSEPVAPVAESVPPVVSEPETIAPVIPESKPAESDSKDI